MTLDYVLRDIASLQTGDHLCCIYEREEEFKAIIIPYMIYGLEQNQKIFYIAEARSTNTIIEYLQEAGIKADPYLETGQLVIEQAIDTYLQGGSFQPQIMIETLRKETDKALAEGYTALRVTGEMSWSQRGMPGSDLLMDYEIRLNTFLPGSKCLAICQYDRKQFSPTLLMDVIMAHPIVVIGDQTYDNFYYVPPEEFYKEDRDESILNKWIENLAKRKELEQNLIRSREFCLSLFQEFPLPIWQADINGIITYVNKAWKDYRGWETAEREQNNRWNYGVHKDDFEKVQEIYTDAVQNRQAFQFEFRWKGEDTSYRWFVNIGRPFRSSEGDLQGFIGALFDISERKKREEERLQQLEHELKALSYFSRTPDTNITSRTFGITPFKQGFPDIFDKFKEEYLTIFDNALENRIYKSEDTTSLQLKDLAYRMGLFKISPRDLVEIHAESLKSLSAKATPRRGKVYVQEGRTILVEMMGYLALFYRNNATNVSSDESVKETDKGDKSYE